MFPTLIALCGRASAGILLAALLAGLGSTPARAEPEAPEELRLRFALLAAGIKERLKSLGAREVTMGEVNAPPGATGGPLIQSVLRKELSATGLVIATTSRHRLVPRYEVDEGKPQVRLDAKLLDTQNGEPAVSATAPLSIKLTDAISKALGLENAPPPGGIPPGGPQPRPNPPRPGGNVEAAAVREAFERVFAAARQGRTTADAIGLAICLTQSVSERNAMQLRQLAALLPKEDVQLVAVSSPSPPLRELLEAAGESAQRYVFQEDLRTTLERRDVNAVLLLGFEKEGDSALETSVGAAALAGRDCYVFADQVVWEPMPGGRAIAAAKQIGQIAWAGNLQGDDLGAFFRSVRSRGPGPGSITRRR
jgi:hypothetical protein